MKHELNNKTYGKDIMLLCKGWYNKEKYTTIKNALIAYYHKHYGCDDILPDYSFINQVLLKEAMNELYNDNMRYSLINNYLFSDHVWSTFHRKDLTYDEELYYRMTEFLGSLKCVTDTETVLIDTDSYWLKENGNYVMSDGHKVLKEQIIE